MSQQDVIEFVQPDPQDWESLERVSEIDMQGFGEDGISVFNFSQFARGGSLFCLKLNGKIIAETVILRSFDGESADVFEMLLGDDLQGRKDYISEYGADYLELADIS